MLSSFGPMPRVGPNFAFDGIRLGFLRRRFQEGRLDSRLEGGTSTLRQNWFLISGCIIELEAV